MFQIRADIIINRPIEAVFEFVAENENDPKWCIPVVATERIVGDAPDAGTRYKYASQMGPLKAWGEFEITEFKPLQRIAFSGYSPATHFQGEFIFVSEGDATRVTEELEFTPQGIYRLLEPIMPRIWQGTYDKQLLNLKQTLEVLT